jgi:predicted peptidase
VAKERAYPLIVIFHGFGAIGTDNVSQIGPVAKCSATPEMRERYPAFVLVPQFAARSAVYSGSGATNTSATNFRRR